MFSMIEHMCKKKAVTCYFCFKKLKSAIAVRIMKRLFGGLALSGVMWFCFALFSGSPDPFSLDRLNKFYDEYVCEEKQELDAVDLASACPTPNPPFPPVPVPTVDEALLDFSVTAPELPPLLLPVAAAPVPL